MELRPDPVWTERYERERERLERHTDPSAVFHVGSTAIPDLAGTPQLDVIAVYDDTSAMWDAADTVAGLDERWRRTDREHRTVVYWRDPPEAVYLKFHVAGDEQVHNQIAVRDHLRADEPDRRRYERVKREAAAEHDGFQPYQEAKAEIVQELIEAARETGRFAALPESVRE